MLKQKLQEDQIVAMKAKDVETLQTLRYILSQIKNIEIDKKIELSDEEVVDVLRKEVKKLQDSIDSFKTANREDLAQEYQAQKDIIVTYLPQEISDEELKAEIQKIISANQELYQQNPSALIGICVRELKAKADASRISATVRSLQ
jgi:uncharacterized protein YqeY